MADYVKSGAETRVNVAGDLSQITPFVTTLSDGRYAIAWGTYASGSTTGAISARIFNADGTPATGEIAVAASTRGGMSVGSIAALDGGGFAVGFMENDTQTVRVRLIGADGAPGLAFEPNPSQATTQFNPEVTALANGHFLVNWIENDAGADEFGMGVWARLYRADGSAIGDRFLVNVQRDQYQSGGKVAALADGGFAIAWTDYNSAVDGSQSTARVRLYGADGQPTTGEIAVNTTTTGSQTVRDVFTLAGGGFVVHYENTQRGGAGQVNSFVQAFDATGAKVGGEIALAGLAGQMTQLPDGSFVHVYSADSLPAEVHLQRYDVAFTPIGPVEYANSALAGVQAGADVAATANGFVVTYFTGDTTVDGSGSAILMQRYAGAGTTAVTGPGDDMLIAPSDTNWRINGGAGDDVLMGVGGNDRIGGGGGSDQLSGGDGDDRLAGGRGADGLYGGAGRDSLDGGEGADRLVGGAGYDLLTGGAGADRFGVDGGDLSNPAGEIDARILDFSQAERDRIDLTELDTALSFVGGTRFSGAGGEIRAFVRDGVTVVQVDVDGDRAADIVLRVDGVHALTAADFML